MKKVKALDVVRFDSLLLEETTYSSGMNVLYRTEVNDVSLTLETFIGKFKEHVQRYHPVEFIREIEVTDKVDTLFVTVRYRGGIGYEFFYSQKKNKSYKRESTLHPQISVAAFRELFDKEIYKTNEFTYVESDAVDVYKRVVMSYLHRYPNNFHSMIKDYELKDLCKYFTLFVMDFNPRTAKDIRTNDLKGWKMMQIYNKNQLTLHDIISSVYPNINPWELLKTTRGTFDKESMRQKAIDFYFGYLDVEDITSTQLVAKIPSVASYYSSNKIGIREVRMRIEFWRNERSY